MILTLQLPRTRSAWLSVWLTSAHSYCFHEGLRGGVDAFVEAAAGRKEGSIINADPLIPLHFERLLKTFPQARWLVVTRRQEAVRRSYRRAVGELQALSGRDNC